MSGRVLYVLKRFPRLSETFVLRELLELEACGEHVLVDALLPPEDGPRHADLARLRAPVRYLPRRPHLRQPGVARVHLRVGLRCPRRWSRLALDARRAGTWWRFVQAGLVADRARRHGARHLHAHFATAAAEVARDAAALAGLPFSVTAHAKDVFQADHAARLAHRVAGAAAVVTVSEFNVRHLRAVLPGTRVLHVPNGVPLPDPVPLPADGPLLCVSRLVAKKGVDVLVEACALLSHELPDLVVEVVGGGPLADDLARLATRRGLSGRVRFLGPRSWDEVEAALARCSMFVLPCRVAADGDRDGMPTAIVEAMARGRPVISTEVVGIPEVVRHGRTGLLVAPDDAPALAAAVLKLAHDPAFARELGAAGRALVAERFDPRHSALRLRSAFGAGATGGREG